MSNKIKSKYQVSAYDFKNRAVCVPHISMTYFLPNKKPYALLRFLNVDKEVFKILFEEYIINDKKFQNFLKTNNVFWDPRYGQTAYAEIRFVPKNAYLEEAQLNKLFSELVKMFEKYYKGLEL